MTNASAAKNAKISVQGRLFIWKRTRPYPIIMSVSAVIAVMKFVRWKPLNLLRTLENRKRKLERGERKYGGKIRKELIFLH